MTTGERIRYYRKLNNMTMVELAHKIGVQHSAIYKYETGRNVQTVVYGLV